MNVMHMGDVDVLVHYFRLISSLVRSGPGFNEGHSKKDT